MEIRLQIRRLTIISLTVTVSIDYRFFPGERCYYVPKNKCVDCPDCPDLCANATTPAAKVASSSRHLQFIDYSIIHLELYQQPLVLYKDLLKQ